MNSEVNPLRGDTSPMLLFFILRTTIRVMLLTGDISLTLLFIRASVSIEVIPLRLDISLIELLLSVSVTIEVIPLSADISLIELLFRSSKVREVKFERADISLIELLFRSSEVSAVSPLKSPVFRELIDLFAKFRDVIAARCAMVTSFALLTPGTAATIASRTAAVRSLTDGIGVSFTSVTLIVTVMLSLPPFLSETETDTA